MIDLKNLVSLPTYTTTIPSTGKKVSFRPFVVKEEKVLLIALESKNNEQITNALKTVFESCFNEKINVDEMSYFDIEYLFIQLRMKSMGEIVEIIVKDPTTNEKFETEMKLENIKVLNLTKNKKNFDIKLNDKFGVIMKYPRIVEFAEFGNTDKNKIEIMFELMALCIDKIYTPEQVIEAKDKTKEELKDFLENLPKEMFLKIAEFFDILPQIVYKDEFISPTTGNKIPILINDFKTFFV